MQVLQGEEVGGEQADAPGAGESHDRLQVAEHGHVAVSPRERAHRLFPSVTSPTCRGSDSGRSPLGRTSASAAGRSAPAPAKSERARGGRRRARRDRPGGGGAEAEQRKVVANGERESRVVMVARPSRQKALLDLYAFVQGGHSLVFTAAPQSIEFIGREFRVPLKILDSFCIPTMPLSTNAYAKGLLCPCLLAFLSPN